ncbi:hypothetical protein ACFCYN_20895 [Gottfriedia sp. NPDC056225]|uniref:hypothetical protein n=1 Tax=Gottfriedia sp. NPDC056225 TaxID=3345751 RepID=UPI0035DA4009
MGKDKDSKPMSEQKQAHGNGCSGDTVTLEWDPITNTFFSLFQSSILASGTCFPQGVTSFVEVNECLINKGFRIVASDVVVAPGRLAIIYVKC